MASVIAAFIVHLLQNFAWEHIQTLNSSEYNVKFLILLSLFAINL